MTLQPRFIQIHSLHSYPAALLNRDDAGLAKRLPLGNAVRTRISSQCLKRHWRIAEDRFALSTLDVPMALRSRGTLELMRKRIAEAGVSEPLARIAHQPATSMGLDIARAPFQQNAPRNRRIGRCRDHTRAVPRRSEGHFSAYWQAIVSRRPKPPASTGSRH